MSNLNQQEQITLPPGYVKSSDGTKISPITSVYTVFNDEGEDLHTLLETLDSRLNSIIGNDQDFLTLAEIKELLIPEPEQLVVMSEEVLISESIYSDKNHRHDESYYTKTELNRLLENKAILTHEHEDLYYSKEYINSLIEDKAPLEHTHEEYCTSDEIESLLENKANDKHDHDDRYYTENEINVKLSSLFNKGASSFAGNEIPKVVTHGLKRVPTFVSVTPISPTSGNLGDVYVTYDNTNIYVHNTGTAVVPFVWLAM